MIESFKKLKKYSSNNNVSKSNIDIDFDTNLHYKFKLLYQNKIIGILKYENNTWIFEYSEWFKNQSYLQPLLQFPNTSITYKSTSLWPFFESRIPSSKQKKLKEYFAKNPKDKNNTAKLLSKFGTFSINNPYKLIAC